MRGLLRSVVALRRCGGSNADGPTRPEDIDRSIRELYKLTAANIAETETRAPS